MVAMNNTLCDLFDYYDLFVEREGEGGSSSLWLQFYRTTSFCREMIGMQMGSEISVSEQLNGKMTATNFSLSQHKIMHLESHKWTDTARIHIAFLTLLKKPKLRQKEMDPYVDLIRITCWTSRMCSLKHNSLPLIWVDSPVHLIELC